MFEITDRDLTALVRKFQKTYKDIFNPTAWHRLYVMFFGLNKYQDGALKLREIFLSNTSKIPKLSTPTAAPNTHRMSTFFQFHDVKSTAV